MGFWQRLGRFYWLICLFIFLLVLWNYVSRH